jgi:hypothetical protein
VWDALFDLCFDSTRRSGFATTGSAFVGRLASGPYTQPAYGTEEWERSKAELQRDADRPSTRATGTAIHDRIDANLAAGPWISAPIKHRELDTRRKIFEIFRAQRRTAVMHNAHFREKQTGG